MQAGTRSVPAKSGPPMAGPPPAAAWRERLGQIAAGAALRAAQASIRPLLTAHAAAIPGAMASAIPGGIAVAIPRRVSSGWP